MFKIGSLVDSYGRVITSLRISVTQRCNLSCFYCHHEGESDVLSKEEMNAEDIVKVCKVANELGVSKVKITGGEPLLRKDIEHILAEMPNFSDISMTTNGTLLGGRASELKASGLKRVNVSMDTIDKNTYSRITGGGKIKDVIKGIEDGISNELTPLKLNMVMLKGINSSWDDVENMIEFVKNFNGDVILQMIELMPRSELNGYYISLNEYEERLKNQASRVITRSMHRRRIYDINGTLVEVVRPMDNSSFCANCTRLRLTSDGRLRGCLLSRYPSIKLKEFSHQELERSFHEVARLRKPYWRE